MRCIALTLGVVLLGATPLLTQPLSAQAVEFSGVTSVTIEAPDPANPGRQLVAGEQFRVDASWSAPATAHAGDTFTLNFPSPVVAYAANIDLLDEDGALVGTCVASASSIVCTLNDYVDSHSNVHGNLYFYATASSSTDETEIDFSDGHGTVITTQLPGGGIGVGGTANYPTSLVKSGAVTQDNGSIQWTIWVPSEMLDPRGGSPVVITDTATGNTALDTDSLTVRYVERDDFNSGHFENSLVDVPPAPGAGTYNFENDPANSAFSLSFNDPVIDGSRMYIIQYYSHLPAGVTPGTVFSNTVSANGANTVTHDVEYVTAGGNGQGDDLKSLQLTKRVDGGGAVPAGSFTFTVDCVADGASIASFPREVRLRADETVTVDGIPDTASCTVDETDSLGADAVSFSPASTVQFTAASPAVVEVVATNTFSPELGGFTVTKQVTGDGAALVAASAEYTVKYSYSAAGSAGAAGGELIDGELSVRAGETTGIADLPVGAVVTLSELAPVAVDGVTYGTPVFSGTGVTQAGDSATIRIGEGTDAAVLLENPVSRVPAETPPETPAVTPHVPPAPTAPGNPVPAVSAPALAETGFSHTGGLLIAGAALILVGAVALTRKGKQRFAAAD